MRKFGYAYKIKKQLIKIYKYITFEIDEIKFQKKRESTKIIKVHNGITFESSSIEGIDKLIEYYEVAKAKAAGELSSHFFDAVENDGITITDYDYGSKKDKDGNYYLEQCGEEEAFFNTYTGRNSYKYPKVYIGSYDITNQVYGTLYHELGHLLDWIEEEYYFGYEGIKKAIDKLSNKPNILEEGKSVDNNELFYRNLFFQGKFKQEIERIEEFLKSPEKQKEIEEQAKKEFTTIYKTTNYSSPGFEEFKEQVYYEYYDREMSNTGMYAISDIFDSLYLGRMREDPLFIMNKLTIIGEKGKARGFGEVKSRNGGHGSKYYKDDPQSRTSEILANVSDLYNSGKIDLLYEYFPKEFVDDIIEVFNTIVMNTYYYTTDQEPEQEENESKMSR